MARPQPTDEEEARALQAWLDQAATPEEAASSQPRAEAPMSALAQFSAPQSQPRVTQAQTAAPAKDPYSGTDLALAALADLFLNKGRGMGGIISLGAQNQDNDWETQQRQMKLDEAAAQQQDDANDEARYAQANAQGQDERQYQRGRDARTDALAARKAAAAGPAANAKAKAARDEWDRQQAQLHANRMKERAAGKRAKGKGAGGGSGGADVDAMIADAEINNDVTALREAMPRMNNPEQRKRASAAISRISSGKRTQENKTVQTPGQAAIAGKQYDRAQSMADERASLMAVKEKLEARDPSSRIASRGNFVERAWTGTKAAVGGGSGMSSEDTELDTDLTTVGLQTYTNKAHNAPNSEREQNVAQTMYSGDGTAQSALKRVNDRLAVIDAEAGADPEGRINSAPRAEGLGGPTAAGVRIRDPKTGRTGVFKGDATAAKAAGLEVIR